MSANDAAGQPSRSQQDKPAVLIIGGLGYIGRHLAHHIHTHSLASSLRIVDKQLPQLAQLSPEHAALPCFSPPHFLQADASLSSSTARIFADLPPGAYVLNCAAETRHSLPDAVYAARSHAPALLLARAAAAHRCAAHVALSTGHVYAPSAKSPPRPRTEDDRAQPESRSATRQAKWALKTEAELARVPGLPLVVLRLAHVYGGYGAGWLGTQLALARVYQDLGGGIKYLWGDRLRVNTVHVADVARAVWAAAEWRAATTAQKEGDGVATFNVVDDGDTSQATMARILADVFGIETGFQKTLVNTFARLNLERVVDELNDETLDAWADLLQDAAEGRRQDSVAAGDEDKGKVVVGGSSPLSPFMEKELLKDADLCMDGARFKQVVGFEYEHKRIDAEECRAVIDNYKRMGWWP